MENSIIYAVKHIQLLPNNLWNQFALEMISHQKFLEHLDIFYTES